MSELLSGTQRAILVIDDQVGTAGSLHQQTFLRNYQRLPYVFLFESCVSNGTFDSKKALKALESHPEVQVVLLDLKFGNDEEFGFTILKGINRWHRNLPVLVMSSMDRDVRSLGRCLEEGALGFVVKHRSAEYLQQTIEQAISLMQSHVLLGQSPAMRELRRQAARLSPYQDISVLISGERGTGKERVGRYIWQSGRRSREPFIHVDCANSSEAQLETELFGSTDAANIGALTRADHGVLFLDDVGCLPLRLQTRLMRVVEQKVTGPQSDKPLSLQIISSTSVNPEDLVQGGRLLEEFYDLLAAVKIETPPLRRCPSDVPILANYFLQRLSNGQKQFADDALRQLVAYQWPANVRELQRVVQEAVVRSEDAGIVRVKHLPDHILSVQTALLQAPAPRSSSSPVEDLASETDSLSPWARQRMLAELKLALEIKDKVQAYKGNSWRAEFMRCLYPNYKAQNAKGLADVIKRFTHGPWGDPDWAKDPELVRLINELKE